MSEKWFFRMDGETVVLRARLTQGGVVGDAFDRIEPDDEIVATPGLTYAALKEAGGGVLEIADDGTFTITPASRSEET